MHDKGNGAYADPYAQDCTVAAAATGIISIKQRVHLP